MTGSEFVRPHLQSAPLGVASHTLLAEHEQEFFSRWRKTARTFQEDDVHDLRVASRRLREGLALFAPCFTGKRTSKVVKQVKKVTKMLGTMRNTDEAFLFFSSLGPEESAQSRQQIEELLNLLRREREQAHQRLRKELRKLDPDPLRADLNLLQREQNLFVSSGIDPFTNIALFARDAIMQGARPLVELLPQAIQEDNSEAQHQLRIAVKKMRYRLEILAPLLKWDYDELHGALKAYQEVLGKLHDVDVFAEMLQERLADAGARQGLLRVLAQRRRGLHGSFLELLKSLPLQGIGERARDAL